MRPLVITMLLLLAPGEQPQNEPNVRIGLNQNASSVTVRSAVAFKIRQHTTRSATFSTVLALDAAREVAKKSDLQRRLTVELDGDVLLVLPLDTRVRIESPGAPFEIETRAYRGALEVFGNARRTLTRSEEHTSELQSLRHLVCRLLLETKKRKNRTHQ